MIYLFDQFSIDTGQYQLSRDGKPVPVEPLVFDLMIYLIENCERVVGRDELLENLWQGKVVTDSALAARLKDVRKALGDSGDRQKIIKTVHGRGYQFIANVSALENIESQADNGIVNSKQPGVVLRGEVCAFEVLMGDDDSTIGVDLQRTRAKVVAAVESAGGEVADTPGDTVIAHFADATKAFDTAVMTRNTLAKSQHGPGALNQIQYRFGIDTGSVEITKDGPAGPAVEATAGLANCACTQGVAFSNAVRILLSASGKQSFSELQSGAYVVASENSETSVGPAEIAAFTLPLPKKPSLVILPFTCIDNDPETQALANGLRVDMQSMLLQLTSLFVISYGTANKFAGKAGVEAGPRLGVRHTLEGSVQCSGDRVRINMQLTDTVNGQVTWSKRYDRILEDTFTLQDEIAENIVTNLDVKLISGEQGRLWRKCLTNPRARDLHYRGLWEINQGTCESLAAARAHFKRVAELVPDSTFGPTYVALCLWFETVWGLSDDPVRTRSEAGEWAERAVEKEDADGQAHTVLGNVRLLQGRYDEALAVATESIFIRPGCTMANGFLANVLLHCGAYADAITHARRAIRFAPVYSPWFVEILANSYRENGQLDLAVAATREVLRVAPQTVNSRIALVAAQKRLGWDADAKRVANEIRELDASFSVSRFAAAQPFREESVRRRLARDLCAAGLPD